MEIISFNHFPVMSLWDIKIATITNQKQVLTALVGQLSLIVGLKNGPEWGLRLFHLTINFL